jgi:N-acyl-D-aspartate/D-glutamate deacylase
MLGLEEAVHKMTGLPAATVGLNQGEDPRGLLRPGFMADVVVIDPKAVRDTATFDQPHQLAEGFDTVLVNGVVVRGSGEETGERGGRVLRKR